MSLPVSFPANGNTDKLEKLKLMIEKLEKENKEHLKTNQHLTQNAKLVYQQNKLLKDAINDKILFYEQILDKYSRSIRTLQTATDNNRKMSKIYQGYKSKLINSQKINEDCIFNSEINKIDREIKNIQIRSNHLNKKFQESEIKVLNYRILFSLDTKLAQINKLFTNEAKNCISANPCFFSNSRLDKLQQKIKKGDEIKKSLFEEDKNEETKYILKNISEKFDRYLSIYNQIFLIMKKRELMMEDDLEGLSENNGFSYEKVESKVPKNFGYDVEISELKRIVEHSGFDYLNDPEREKNYKKIRSLFFTGFNSSIYKSTESTESYDSDKENNDEKLLDSSDECEYEEEEEEEFLNKYVSIKVNDSNLKNENVSKNSNFESGNQPKSKQIYLPILPIYQQPTFKQNSPRIHLIKDTKQIETINLKENTKKEQSHEEENIKEEQSSEEINSEEEQSYDDDESIEEVQSSEEENIKEKRTFKKEKLFEEEQSSEEINIEENQSYDDDDELSSDLDSSDFDASAEIPIQNEELKHTDESETSFECILNRQEENPENSFLLGCLEISSSSEDSFCSSRTENEDQMISLYQKSEEDESDSLKEDDYLSERSFLTDKFHLSDEQNKKSSQDEKIEPLIPIIKAPISLLFEPYKFKHSSEFSFEDHNEQLEEELEKEKINIQQLEELKKEEHEKELFTKSKALEPPPKLKVKKPNSLLIRPNKSRQRSFIKNNQKKTAEESDFSLENSHENDLYSVTSSDVFVLSSSQQSMKSEELIEPLIPNRKREKQLNDKDDSIAEFILEISDSESEKSNEKQETEEDINNHVIISSLETNCIHKKKQKVSTYDPSIFYPVATIYPRTEYDYFSKNNDKMHLTVSLKDIGLEGFDSCKIEKMKELQRLQKVQKEEQKTKKKSRIVVEERNNEKNYSFSTNSEAVSKLSIYGKSSSQRKEKISSLNRKKMEKIEPYVDSNHMPTSLLNSTQKAQKVHAIRPITVPKTFSRINKSKSSVVDGNQLNSFVCRSPRRYKEVKND